MKSYHFICPILISFLFACGSSNEPVDPAEIDPTELTKVEGGKFQGGVLRLNSIEDYTSLFPASTNDVYSTHIASQGYEGLLRLNQKTLEIEPCLAESFEIDKQKKIYTFHIRKKVAFADNECFPEGKGREVNANDIKYCFDFLCAQQKANKWKSLFLDRVKGATAYYHGESNDVEGIRVVDDYTLEIELIEPFSSFPSLLTLSATCIYPKEAIEHYGYKGMHDRIVGTGPFVSETIKNGEKVTFNRNNKYWRKDDFGNQLPLLSRVEFSFIKDKNNELQAFKDDDLDMVWGIPVEEIPNIMGTLQDAKEGLNRPFEVQSISSMNIQYYGFLHTSKVFENLKVRQAFNYAIDRDSLVDFILQGEGSAANNGFVPKMKGYPGETVEGFSYDPKRAKKLLKEAGYPGGKGFPEITLHLNASGGVNKKVADAVTKMLKDNLGVAVNLNVIPMAELQPQVERAQLDFWRFGWIADYPDPSNFLYLFHGKNIMEEQETSVNFFRYANPEFDKIYEAAISEIDTKKRMELYAQADQILIDDAVMIPLYFKTSIRLLSPDLHYFHINEMEYRDLAVVYYKKKDRSKVRVYDNLPEEEDSAVSEDE